MLPPCPEREVEESVPTILFRILAKDVDLLSLASKSFQEDGNLKTTGLAKKDRITVCLFRQ